MTKNHEIKINGAPEQSTQDSLEDLNSSEVRNPNNQDVETRSEFDTGCDNAAEVENASGKTVRQASSPTSSDQKKHMRVEIGAALSKCFDNFLKDWVNPLEYQGYCWTPEDDFDLLCEALSGVSTVASFSMQDKEMLREIDERGPSDLIHLRIFSTLSDRKGHRTIEVSGTLSLGVLRDDSAAHMIGGITGEDPIIVKFHCSPHFYELRKYSKDVEKELVPLFRIPMQYGNSFIRFTVGRDDNECKEVSRYQAERDLIAAMRRPLPEKKKKGSLICDSCGKEAGPDAEFTAMLKEAGHYRGTEPLRALSIVSVDGEIKSLCSTCSGALNGNEQAA